MTGNGLAVNTPDCRGRLVKADLGSYDKQKIPSYGLCKLPVLVTTVTADE